MRLTDLPPASLQICVDPFSYMFKSSLIRCVPHTLISLNSVELVSGTTARSVSCDTGLRYPTIYAAVTLNVIPAAPVLVSLRDILWRII